MKKYKMSICMVLLAALALSSFFVFAQTVQDTNITSPIAITFEPNGGDLASSYLIVNRGDEVQPVYPTREGYVFDGWFTASDFSQSFTFENKLSGSVTLYAKWTALSTLTEVSFGAYPQQRVTDADTLAHLNLLSPINGYYEYNSKRYVAIEITDTGAALQNGYPLGEYVYFEVMPLVWRIIKTVDDSYILMTKNIIDCLPYHTADTAVTYAASSLREFLNEDFFDTAFNSVEQGAIITSALTNADNEDFHSEGGIDTSDKVYILSFEEARNSADFADDASRRTTGSDFAKAKGLGANPNANFLGLSRWWLRSPGEFFIDAELGIDFNNAASVDSNGKLSSIGSRVTAKEVGVRPVICVPSLLFE